MTVIVQGYSLRIFGTDDHKQVAKSAKNNPACNCHSSAPIKAAKVPKVPCYGNGPSNL